MASIPILLVLGMLALPLNSQSQTVNQMFADFDTNLDKKNIDLSELLRGGPPKDGIPSIDDPKYVSHDEAAHWLGDQEPVIALEINGVAKAYPLQILMWHEIANDEIEGTPVSVTFCPLCNSAIVFDRRVGDEVLDFGVSGFLRHSDLVMFDRQTETLWQQITGEGIVGDYTDTILDQIPSQIISFEQFRELHPEGTVLSRDTGHDRQYGRNPYVGYDNINQNPMLLEVDPDDRLRPMEKVVGVTTADEQRRAYPYSITEAQRVINDEIGDLPIVVFHVEGAVSALDASRISDSREAGSTGAFVRTLGSQTLTFTYEDGEIRDNETGSTWTINGRAVSGELEGERLEQLKTGDYFAFAWLVFFPDTDIFREGMEM